MIKVNTFDEVHDCQKSFRLMLRALSNPGETVSLKEQADCLEDADGVFLTIALTLLDKETAFCVADNPGMAEKIAQVTYAGNTAMEAAGFLFVTKTCMQQRMEEIMKAVHPGTLIEPHTNCVLIVGVDRFPEEGTCTLAGPGIKGSRRVGLPDEAIQWLRQRDKVEFEYPMGVDLYFVTKQGEILAVPRKVKMEG